MFFRRILFGIVFRFSGIRGASAAEKVSVKVTGLKGPTGVGLVNLWKSQDDGAAKNDYTFYLAEAPEDAKNRLVTGDADIAAVPTNVAAALYKATGGKVKLLAVNTLGVLQIVEKGDTIQSVADLRGKTIYTTGQGANPEYVLNYVLEKNGIDPARDVTIEFVSTNDELATLLATDENVKVAMIPEPSATTVKAKDDSLRTALDMTKAWDEGIRRSQPADDGLCGGTHRICRSASGGGQGVSGGVRGFAEEGAGGYGNHRAAVRNLWRDPKGGGGAQGTAGLQPHLCSG